MAVPHVERVDSKESYRSMDQEWECSTSTVSCVWIAHDSPTAQLHSQCHHHVTCSIFCFINYNSVLQLLKALLQFQSQAIWRKTGRLLEQLGHVSVLFSVWYAFIECLLYSRLWAKLRVSRWTWMEITSWELKYKRITIINGMNAVIMV